MNTAFLQLLKQAKNSALAVFAGQSQTVVDAIEYMASHISAGLAQQEPPAPAPALTHLSDSELLEIGARYSKPLQFSRAFDEAGWLAAGREIEARNQHVIRVSEEKLQSDAAIAPARPALSDDDIIEEWQKLWTTDALPKSEYAGFVAGIRLVEAHCREGVSPLPRPTRWAALNAVTDEWDRRDRPSRPHQAAIIIAADLALDIAEELEFIAEKIRQGNITEGAGGGSGFNWSWCVISDQGGQQ